MRRMILFVPLLACSIVGCSNSKEGSVTGKVTMSNKPVMGMTITFNLPGQGVGASAVLNEAGTFSFPAPLPVGLYTVTITAPVPLPPEPGQKKPPPAPTPVPSHFGREDKSGLRADVKGGNNEFTFDLTAGK